MEADEPPHLRREPAPAAAAPDAHPAGQPDGNEVPGDDREELLRQSLARIALNVAKTRRLKTQLDDLVARARVHGASWRMIGEAASIGASVAHRRWDPLAAEKQRQREREARRRQRGSKPRAPE